MSVVKILRGVLNAGTAFVLLAGFAMAGGVSPAPVVVGTAAGTVAAGNDSRIVNAAQLTSAGGLFLSLITGGSDLGIKLFGGTVYNWNYNAGSGNGTFYLYDQKSNTFPFNVQVGAVSGALTLTPIGAAVGGALKLPTYTVANLPGCTSTYQDMAAAVTDATAYTAGSAPAGGGSKRVPVYCDGSSWTMH